MRAIDRESRRVAALAAVMLSLAACAGPAATRPAGENPLQRAVQSLLARQAEGQLGAIRGVGSVKASVEVFLANGEVALIPSTPQLEQDMRRFHRRWLEGRRQPLPFREANETFRLLTVQRAGLAKLGGQSLLRFAKTDAQGRFTFEQVPAGRWLAVTDISGPVSALLWAVPVEVMAGQTTRLSLSDASVLLEARKEKPEETIHW